MVAVQETTNVLAERMADLRTRTGLGYIRLERASGVSRQQLIRLYKGDTNPSVASLHRLGVVFGVHPAALVEDVPEEAPVPTVIDDAAVRQGVARRIVEARTALGWTQADLAERLGSSQGTLSGIERGVRSISLHMARRYAAALDRPLWWLLWDD